MRLADGEKKVGEEAGEEGEEGEEVEPDYDRKLGQKPRLLLSWKPEYFHRLVKVNCHDIESSWLR